MTAVPQTTVAGDNSGEVNSVRFSAGVGGDYADKDRIKRMRERYKAIDSDEVQNRIKLLSVNPEEMTAPTRNITTKSEQDINRVLRFFNDIAKINWRKSEQISKRGQPALHHLQGMTRSRFITAVANISKQGKDSMSLLLDNNPEISLRNLQRFFRQDKRIVEYVISRIPAHQHLLKSLGGVDTISYTMEAVDRGRISSVLDEMGRERADNSGKYRRR